LDGHIAQGRPVPIQAGKRWRVERTHAWATPSASSADAPSGAGGLVECYLALAQAIIIACRLVRRAWTW
jgi:hypothetical protein